MAKYTFKKKWVVFLKKKQRTYDISTLQHKENMVIGPQSSRTKQPGHEESLGILALEMEEEG